MKISAAPAVFRYGFYAGLLLAFGLGVYLFDLWGAENQVRLHSEHLITGLEEKDWPAVRDFLDEAYQDQWGHDRSLVLERLRGVLSYARGLKISASPAPGSMADGDEKWSAQIRIEGEPNEVTLYLRERVNALPDPFELAWRQRSWKPWDWKLVRVRNPSLELPAGQGY